MGITTAKAGNNDTELVEQSNKAQVDGLKLNIRGAV